MLKVEKPLKNSIQKRTIGSGILQNGHESTIQPAAGLQGAIASRAFGKKLKVKPLSR